MFEYGSATIHGMAVAGLAVVVGTSLMLWRLGSSYARRYVLLNGAMPRLTWMFRRADDPELERARRIALLLVPLYFVGAALYILGS
jgi:hypothetical protein